MESAKFVCQAKCFISSQSASTCKLSLFDIYDHLNISQTKCLCFCSSGLYYTLAFISTLGNLDHRGWDTFQPSHFGTYIRVHYWNRARQQAPAQVLYNLRQIDSHLPLSYTIQWRWEGSRGVFPPFLYHYPIISHVSVILLMQTRTLGRCWNDRVADGLNRSEMSGVLSFSESVWSECLRFWCCEEGWLSVVLVNKTKNVFT